MTNLNFWKKWHWELRFPYLFLLLLTLAALGLGIYYYFTGFDNTIRWEQVTLLQTVDVLVKPFYVLLKEFGTDVNGYLVTEHFDASLPYINVQAAVIYGIFLLVCLTLFLAILTTVKRIAYFAGILLLMLLLASMNLDGLGIFGSTSSTLLLVTFGILGISSYALQAFFPNISFLKRLLILAFLVVGLAVFILSQSELTPQHTVLHLVNHGSLAGFVITLLFLLFIAYENIHLLLWFNTQADTPQRRFGFWPFFLISILYLLNLLLLFFKTSYLYDFGLIYLDAFLIFVISIMTGFWGLSRRQNHYKRFFPFAPAAAYLYLIFAILAILNIGYAFATANDPIIAAYDALIIMFHLAFGFMFFIYIMANFGRLLFQKLAVHRIVYDPKRIPFFTVYVMGGILLLALLFRAHFLVYDQVMAGYYNYLGDVYKTTGDDLLAERYYEEGAVYEHFNVKSNYSLAAINRERKYINTEINYLKEALRLRPSEKVFTRLANMYTSKELFFEQMYVLQQGLDSFPESAALNNNLALLYSQSDLIDSTAYYLEIAKENAGNNKDVINGNLLSFYIKYGLPEPAQKLAEENEKSNSPGLKNNIILLNLLLGKESEYPLYLPEQAPLNNRKFSLFYNSLLQHINDGDSSTVQLLDSLIKMPQNQLYSEDLHLLKAIVQHYNHYPNAAKTTLVYLSAISENSTGYYLDVLGQWMLEKGLYADAANYFRKAIENSYPPALTHHAYAQALAGKAVEAQKAINRIYETNQKDMIAEASAISDLIGLESGVIASDATDSVRVQYLMVNHNTLIPLEIATIVKAIQDPELQAIAQKEQAKILLERKDFSAVQKVLNDLKPKLADQSELQARVNLIQASLWASSKNYTALQKNFDQLYIAPELQPYSLHYKALIAETQKQTEKAAQLYDSLVVAAVYDADGMIAAANFFNKQKERMKAYEILLKGVTYNPYSVALMKAYTLQSTRLRLTGFAEYGMEQLSILLPEEEYATFKQQYEQVLKESDVTEDDWK